MDCLDCAWILSRVRAPEVHRSTSSQEHCFPAVRLLTHEPTTFHHLDLVHPDRGDLRLIHAHRPQNIAKFWAVAVSVAGIWQLGATLGHEPAREQE